MQHRASPGLTPQRGHTSGQTAPQACVLISMCTHKHVIYVYTHTCIYRRKPAIRNKASTRAKSSPVLFIPLGKDICSQFHLKVATLRWLRPLQNSDGGHPPQQGQHSQIPASPYEPFSSKQWACPRDASAPLPGCWRGGKGQQHSSPQAESSLVLQ